MIVACPIIQLKSLCILFIRYSKFTVYVNNYHLLQDEKQNIWQEISLQNLSA